MAFSELTSATVSNIDDSNWVGQYNYRKDGNIDSKNINGDPCDFAYDGDLMVEAHGETLDWDLNGNMVTSITAGLEYNWDNKLRSGSAGSDSVHCKYAPDGSMVYMETTTNGQTTKHKYIVDTVGEIPVILMVLDANDNDAVVKTYIHANGQVLMQHDGDMEDQRYFYLHDRLGSVRQVIDTDADVVNCYTYDPWGSTIGAETNETLPNRYRFAGYRWNPQLLQYYCNARWYDPTISRFSARDPVKGEFQEPMTVHAYLYCGSDPVNRIDPLGLKHYNAEETQAELAEATEFVGRNFITGPGEAFYRRPWWNPFSLKEGKYDYLNTGHTFTLGEFQLEDTEFGNYLAGYTCAYNYSVAGIRGVRLGGHFFEIIKSGNADDADSVYFIAAGVLKGQANAGWSHKLQGTFEFLLDRFEFVEASFNLYRGIERAFPHGYNTKEYDREFDRMLYFWNKGRVPDPI